MFKKKKVIIPEVSIRDFRSSKWEMGYVCPAKVSLDAGEILYNKGDILNHENASGMFKPEYWPEMSRWFSLILPLEMETETEQGIILKSFDKITG